MTVGVLFCADPLRPRRVDGHFADQAQAVRDLDGAVALIDHDALTAGRAEEAVARVPAGFGPAWYRGWMVGVERYRALEEALGRRGCRLLTDGDAYRSGHELPGWIDRFRTLTPETVVLPLAPGEEPSVADAVAELGEGGYVVKDYVKSRKHEWLEACHAPDSTALPRVVARFVELAGGDLTGGVVVRRFEDFAGGETRVWWLDGDVVFAGPHPDTPGDPAAVPDDLIEIRDAVRALDARFVTTDVARRSDGVWRVIEVGDGQVSDWPAGADPAVLMKALLAVRA
ncbi:ATP-grasp domain-containing protein [Rhizohabitans arisaemae]|uniref:ATP-grasp domain-containing protein n=1 Tax=Rhizohabitans arisaemae TaxID=2720610 RepID=UPI0024B10909|nr:ATP-grasp domain-containing protein [Rhizohabitans arisaemae]